VVATEQVAVEVEGVVMEFTVLSVLTSVVLEDSSIIMSESDECSSVVSNVEGFSVPIAEYESGTAVLFVEDAMEVTALSIEVVVGVEAGAVAVNMLRAEFEKGAIIPILVTSGTPILRIGVVSAVDCACTPMPTEEVTVGVTMEDVVGTPKLIAPDAVGLAATVTPATALPLEMVAITALVVAVTASHEETSWA
jgi:hypothetical protein